MPRSVTFPVAAASAPAPTFARAVELFGYEGVVNLAALMANYAMTAVMLDAVNQEFYPERTSLVPLS